MQSLTVEVHIPDLPEYEDIQREQGQHVAEVLEWSEFRGKSISKSLVWAYGKTVLEAVGKLRAHTDLVTITQAATMRGVGYASVLDSIKRGKLRDVEVGGQRMVLRSEVEMLGPRTPGYPRVKGSKTNA